jgi:hypothetical protein
MPHTPQTWIDDSRIDWRAFTGRDSRVEAIAADLSGVYAEVPEGARW